MPSYEFYYSNGGSKKDPLAHQDTQLTALEAQVQLLIKENTEFKERLCKVKEAQAMGYHTLHTKVQEVTTLKTMLAVQKEVQEMAHEKIDGKIQATLQEDKLQESLSLQVRIGVLPSTWDKAEDACEESIDKLNNILHTI